MTTVGFICSGNVGGTVARLAVAAGYDVVLSIPPRAYTAVPVQPLASKPVFDTINSIPQRDGRISGLSDGSLSSSEVLQRHLGTAHVVKVFNNITFWHLASLARPAGAADRSALPIAGDDPAAKAAVTRFLDAIGYDTMDAATLGSGPPLPVRYRRVRRTVGHVERPAGYPGRRGGSARRPRRLTRPRRAASAPGLHAQGGARRMSRRPAPEARCRGRRGSCRSGPDDGYRRVQPGPRSSRPG